jgi:hypothetical protein
VRRKVKQASFPISIQDFLLLLTIGQEKHRQIWINQRRLKKLSFFPRSVQVKNKYVTEKYRCVTGLGSDRVVLSSIKKSEGSQQLIRRDKRNENMNKTRGHAAST